MPYVGFRLFRLFSWFKSWIVRSVRRRVLVDGRVLQAPFRRVNNEALLTEIELGPGESRTVEVVTFPEASSNYPAQFEFRDQEPVSGVPASPSSSLLQAEEWN